MIKYIRNKSCFLYSAILGLQAVVKPQVDVLRRRGVLKQLHHSFCISSSPTSWNSISPRWAPAISWPAARTGRWRCTWRGSPRRRWWPAGPRSSPGPRGLLSSGARWCWRIRSRRRRRHRRRRSPRAAPRRSAASARCGWTRTGRPAGGRPAERSAVRRPGSGHPEGRWRSLRRSHRCVSAVVSGSRESRVRVGVFCVVLLFSHKEKENSFSENSFSDNSLIRTSSIRTIH